MLAITTLASTNVSDAVTPRARLLADHEHLERLLRLLLIRARAGDSADVVTPWRNFEEGLRAHLVAEEEELFPYYALLAPEEVGALRREPQAGYPRYSQSTAFLLSYFLGSFGADRFYIGQTGLGVLKLLTCGGFGLWALIDLVLIGMGKFRDAEGNSLRYES